MQIEHNIIEIIITTQYNIKHLHIDIVSENKLN